jgi:predicted DNA-binding helix-hairpin-helix protein
MKCLNFICNNCKKEYNFNGYIHTKSIPGSSPEIIDKVGHLVDRMSINIELPSSSSLKLLAPDKEKNSILKPMEYVSTNIATSKLERSRYKDKFIPARTNYTVNYRCYT